MALTTSSRFTYVGLITVNSFPSGIRFTYRDGTEDVRGGASFLDLDGRMVSAEMTTLRSIYASDDGFLDPDGDPITIDVEGSEIPHLDSFDDLESLGYPNPLKAASVAEHERVRQLIGDTRNTTRTVQSDGEIRHQSSLADIPMLYTPTGTTQDVNLDPWQGYISQTDPNHEFTLTLPLAGTSRTTANVNDHIPVIAMMYELSETLVDGTGTAETDSIYDVPDATRRYAWPHVSEADGDYQFRVVSVTNVLVGTTLNGLTIVCRVTNSTTPDVLDVVNYLNNALATIPVQTNGAAPTRGSTSTPHYAERIGFGTGELFARDGILIWNDLQREQPLRGDFIVGADVSELRAWTGTDMTNPPDRWAPSPTTQVVHLPNGQTTARIRYPQLQSFMGPGMYAPQAFHNRNAGANTGLIILEDWNGNEFLRLQPGQRAELELGHTDEGGAELVGRQLPLRRVQHSAGEAGNLGQLTRWSSSVSHWAIPLPVPSTAGSYLDADAFRIGTATYTADAAANTITTWDIPQALVCTRGGFIEFKQHCEIEVTAATGTITGEHFTTLFRYRGTTLTALPGAYHPMRRDIGGTGDEHLMTVEWSGVVAAGDILIPVYIFPKNLTLSRGSIDVHNFSRDVDLDMHLEIVEAA